jgi:hypothetical protein
VSLTDAQGAWAGILHHVVNEHECLMSYDHDMTHTKCQHVPLPEERNKNYLEKVSDALMALTNNVMDKRHAIKLCRTQQKFP